MVVRVLLITGLANPMFALMRGVTYATIFVGVVLVLVPARLLDVSGVTPPREAGVLQFAGATITPAAGAPR